MLHTFLQPNSFCDEYTIATVMNFGEWLRDHRKRADLTQRDVAKRAGLSFSYVSTLERKQPHTITGNQVLPTRDKVIALAKAVNGDANEALSLTGYAAQTRKPKNLGELITALENLGLPVPQLFGGWNADEDGEGFQEALERIYLDLQLVMNRMNQGRQRPNVNIIDEDDGNEDEIPERENQASRR
jgi:transcriptional regulator with XRE-family HTH domain